MMTSPSFPAPAGVVELKVHPSPHPFVRKGLVARRPRGLPGQALVTVRTPEGSILGDGFWNERSDIALRRLTAGDVRFDAEALERSVDRAVTLRESIPGLTSESDAWRVVHAEGDELSGLVVDRFGDALVLELHSAGWVPLIDAVTGALHRRLGTRHHKVVLSERTARLEGIDALDRSSPGCSRRLRVTEHGVRFAVELAGGHKTGFFCDQRDNRRRFAAQTEGADVLDLCCNSGGFSLAAAVRGRPASVTAVDLDEDALELARRNANLNQVRVSLVHADAFDWLRQMGRGDRRFDAIVVDPPKFIPTRRDEKTGQAKYHDLNRLAVRLLRPGGLLLTCSCSGLLERTAFADLLRVALRKEGRRGRIVAVTGASPDHPVHLECPESEYLKALWMRVW